MYLDHFGLERQPFKITPDTSLFYKGNKRGAALEALQYAISSGEGIIKVVGEVGSGKTMLCRMLEMVLPDNIEVVYIANPSLSPENILHVIAFELKLDITEQSSKLQVMQQLQHYLVEKHAVNRQVVVFVEEAQSMPLETLEEIRLLSNLETSDHKLLQMVLFGQPELDDKLRDTRIRQLKERITHSFYLDPFAPDDIYEYLNFRMRAVGYRGPDIFSQRVANNIEKKSKGLTRRINILADKALMAVFSEGAHAVNKRHIAIAARDSDFGVERSWKPWVYSSVAVLVIATAIWIGTQIPRQLPVAAPLVDVAPKDIDSEPPTSNQPVLPAQAQVMPAEEMSSPASLLDQRLLKTETWLTQASPDYFTIQLILLDALASDPVESYIEDAASNLGMENLYVYRAIIQGREVYSVLYNDFASRGEAVSGLRSLPEKLRSNGAFLRTVRGIKSDITKSQQLAATDIESQ
jgi:type II secretory pathway predicted ATPase ExeA